MAELQKLMKVQKMFNIFNDQPLTKTSRKLLYETIQEAISEYGFVRKDRDKVVDLKWHTEPSLSPEISIGISTDNKIWVCDDSLWRQIEGLYEIEQERRESTWGY